MISYDTLTELIGRIETTGESIPETAARIGLDVRPEFSGDAETPTEEGFYNLASHLGPYSVLAGFCMGYLIANDEALQREDERERTAV